MNWDCINSGINCNDAVVVRDTLRCGGFWLVVSVAVLIWGKLKGYTNKANNFAWFFIVALISASVLSVIAWVIGKVLT